MRVHAPSAFRLRPAVQLGMVAVLAVSANCLAAPVSPINDAKALEWEWKQGEDAADVGAYDHVELHYAHVVKMLEKFEKQPESYERRRLAEGLYWLGTGQQAQEKWSAAIKSYDRSIALEPDHALVYVRRGMARKALGDYDGLISDAEMANKIDSSNASFLDDAHSTVLWRRVKLGFLLLGGLVIALGIIPFTKSLVLLSQAEKQKRG